MKKTYAFVTNEKRDKAIADAVSGVFADYGSVMILTEFRNRLRKKLRQSVDLVEIVRLEKTPLANVERRYKATVYRVIDDIVYQTNPETS